VGPPLGAATARERLDRAAEANKVSSHERLILLITARPDATLAELRDAMPTTAALSTLWRRIDQLGFTIKKNGTRHRTAST
jgi:hypothetical protein